MLPEDHFLSLAVREAMKPRKDWEVAPTDPEIFTPDCFEVDTDSSTDSHPETAGDVDGDIDSSRSVSLFQWKGIKVSSSDEEDERPRSKQKSSMKPKTFGVLLAQLHFILSILSKDNSYLRLPTSRSLHRCALIGGGCSFNVRRASQKEIPELEELSEPYFVIKTANITNERDATARMRDILREVQILTHEPLRSHPNVVKLLGFGWEQLRVSTASKITRWPYLLLEYAGYGSMVDLFEQHVIGLEMRMKICLDVGSGLEALHAADIVHGDVKLENILIFPSTDGPLTAKISDFGFAEVDLDGSQPHVSFRRGTLPWKAPEADRELPWKDVFLTDVYSYGFVIWRTIAYGHRPFVEAGGFVSKEIFEKLEEQKLVDGGILSMACGSVGMVLPAHDKSKVEKALTNSLQRQPPLRDLKAIISALGGVLRRESVASLRTKHIPVEQGLGIYNYGGFDNRLDWQMMQALHSFCGSQHSVEGPLADFLGHCAATLSGWYSSQWAAGVEVDDTNTTMSSLAWMYMGVSACSGSDAASEALYSIFYTLWPLGKTIPSGAYPLLAGRALRSGMEFILRELIDNDVPGKAQFLEFFTTRLCRGVGLVVGSPDPEIPLMDEEMLFKHVEERQLTPEDIFRMTATWGQFSTVRLIYSRFKPDINGQNWNGETALLRACRAGHYEIACWLLKTAKADPTIATKLGVTPLHWIHVFSADEALNLARLLRKSGANPNAIAVSNGSCNVEAQYWFFKGPPLIRAVAAGNEAAICGLLAIGADPLVPIRPGDEDSVIFAARRLRAPILKMLLKEVRDYPVWEVGRSGYSLLAKVIDCPLEYAAKIHGQNHEKARIETFDLLWNWKNRRKFFFHRSVAGEITEKRMLRSITGGGRIPLQEAVYESDMITVKHLMKLTSEATDSGPLFIKKMANIGLQAAVLYEKPAMVASFLSAGADPLQPLFYLQPGKEYQLPPQMFAETSPDEKNALHLCARAGSSAEVIVQHLVDNLKPNFNQNLSNAERNMRNQCAIELTYYAELPGGTDDPLLDKRDESDNTSFFTALQNEEYELANVLRSAGADKNALIRGTPIVEHLLTWSPPAARIALEFLVRKTWGNLSIGRHPRRHYLDLAIAASKDWPPAQAADFVNDVYGYVAPRHDHETGVYGGYYRIGRSDGGPMKCGCHLDWDAHISKAVEGLQPHAVAELVRRRPETKPKDSYSPINALRRSILGLELAENLDERRGRFRAWKRATEMLPIIQHRYPDHRFDISIFLRGIADRIIQQVGPELEISAARFRAGALSAKGLGLQVTRLLTPFLAIAAGCVVEEVWKLRNQVQILIPVAAKIQVVIRKKEQEKEGLELKMVYEEEDGRAEWHKGKLLRGEDLGCDVWE